MKRFKRMACLLLAALMSFAICGTAFAEIKTEKYYEGGELKQDTIDTAEYPEMEIADSSGDEFHHRGVTRSITEPCVIYCEVIFRNQDQNPTITRPNMLPYIKYSYNFEVSLAKGESPDWEDNAENDGEYYGGEFEYLKLTITQEDIDAAGGAVPVTFGFRNALAPDTPIYGLGVTVVGNIRAYKLPAPVNIPGEDYPDTGDEAQLLLWAGLMIAAAAGLIAFRRRAKA